MSSQMKMLNFTAETKYDFADNRLPTLDFSMWINKEGLIEYTFYKKNLCSLPTV